MRLPEPFTFFVDRSLGARVVVEGLRAAGETVQAHDDLFPQDTDDEVWLPAVGEKRWVVLTKDVRIRRDSLPRTALIEACVAAFVLVRGDVNGSVMAGAFVAAIPRMKKVLRRFDVPFIASVSIDGNVAMMHLADGPPRSPLRIK